MTTDGNHQPARRAFGAPALRFLDHVIDAGAVLAAALLIGVMLITSVKVVFRYGLNQSLIGADQISGMLLLYIAFLGAAWVLRRDEHVIIDLLLGHVKPRTRWLLMLVSSFIGAGVCLVVAVFGALEVVDSIRGGVRIAAEVEMPRAVNLIVIPIGFLLMGLQFLRRAVDSLKRGGGDAPLPPPVSVV